MKYSSHSMYQKTVNLNTLEQLVVEWESDWSNLNIRMGDVLIGTVAEKSALKGGRRFTLPDRKTIFVVLTDYGLEVWCEGRELVSGTRSGEKDGFGMAFKSMISVGAFNWCVIFITGPSEFADVDIFARFVLALNGLVLMFLGFRVRKYSERYPLRIGAVLAIINLILTGLLVSELGILASLFLWRNLVLGLESRSYQPTKKL